MSPHARITGYGAYLPRKTLTNDELARTLDTTDEWIYSHTGIRSRHIMPEGQTTSDMAVEAALPALRMAGVRPEDLGMIIVTSCTGDYQHFPSTACLVQDRLGAVGAAAFDLGAACSGFAYALEIARLQVAASGRPLLLVSAEALSRIADWSDRSTCILFGDGAGAMVVEPSETPGILCSVLGSDGGRGGLLYREGGCRTDLQADPGPHYLQMHGRALFSYAVRTFEDLIHQLLKKQGLTLDDVSYIVPHQANLRIIEAVARRMDLPMEKFFMNIDHVANTSSASIPIAVCELADSGRLRSGSCILSIAFGAGVTFGGNVIRWA